MATYRKFIFVNSDGDNEEHDILQDQLQLHSLKLGAAANVPIGGLGLVGDIDLNTTGKVTGSIDPTDPTDLTNKRYVDAIAAGLHPKVDVRVSTTAAADMTPFTYVGANDDNSTATPEVWTLDVSAAVVIDGITLVDGDRILVKDDPAEIGNGIFTWDATGESFRRAADADNESILANSEVKGGMFVFATAGTVNQSKGFILSSPETIATLGTDPLVFATFSAPGPIAVDEVWLHRDGNTINFEYLTVGNVIVGNATNNPAKYDTATAMVVGATGTSQIAASTAKGLVIKALSIDDSQISATADVKPSKLKVDAFSPAVSTTTPVGVGIGDTGQVALEKLQQFFNAMGETATTGDPVGANLIALPDDIEGFSASTDTVAEAIADLLGEDMIVTSGQNIVAGDLLYVTAAGTVEAYDDITAVKRPVGIAVEAVAGNGVLTVKVIRGVIKGLAGLTNGARYFWDPVEGAGVSGWVPDQTSFSSGDYIFQIGVGKAATEAFVAIDFIKKNA